MSAQAKSSTGSLAKRFLVGRAFSSQHLEHTLLPKILALPVFASDALSSVAYATGEILIALTIATTSPDEVRDADLVRDRGADGDRRELVSADRPRLPQRRRGLHREQGEPRHVRGARRGCRTAVRLHDDGDRLDRGRRVRDRVGVPVGEPAQGRPVDHVRRARDDREPPRRARVRHVVRGPHLRVRRVDPASSSGSGPCGASAGARRSCRRPSRSRRRRRSRGSRSSRCSRRSPRVRPRSPGSRRSRTACRRSSGPRPGTRRRRSRSWGRSPSRCSSGSPTWRPTCTGSSRARSDPPSPRSRSRSSATTRSGSTWCRRSRPRS